ncbi:uncharacterized protein EAE97_011361 [Botrytis byssoidea]|uniref:Major facilitator superfamily (MFS) profile domain-containing protein n=1 Tax=Botrytis byssoidea TaxID=139641 RepID=A0A9P5LTE1_9HELO|nr:uncharacterized protein EAE97_011361 [Botrytis byssoidea]KAF7921093.1 hypothetical protein EAE97_011361 [Botrytis byssoidea]
MLVEPRSATDAPAPDGGFVAWVQCASSFSLFFLSWGLLSSFGSFQAYYETDYPSWTPSQISWIGSIQAFFLFGFSIVAGPVFDHGYLSIAVLPAYFDKKQALALGVAASGSAIGGVVFPIIFNQLQPKIGFGRSLRVIGFIILLAATVPILGMRVRTPPSAVRKIFDTSAWKEPPFLVTSIFFFLVFMGAYIPPFYVQSYALDTNIVGGDLVPYLLPLLNVGYFFGRIIPTRFADIYGPFNIDIICVLLSGILAFTWIAVHSTASMILFTVSYGFFSGGLTSISPNLGVALSPDTGVLGVRLGMLLMPISVGILVGNPIAGALEFYGWISLQILTAALLMASLLVVIIARILMYGKSLTIRC